MNEANSSPAAHAFRVLVLEPDEKLGAEIIAALHEAMPDANAAIAYSVEEAQRLVVNQKPELFVLDLDAASDRAQEFVYDLRTSHPDARAIILTSGHLSEQREGVAGLGAVHFLEKPFPKNDFMTLAEAMLAPAANGEGANFQGRLSDLHIADIIQLKCISGATSLLGFTGPRGEKARVYFERGQVRHAETPGREGREAFNEIVEWKGGLITEVPVPENPKRTIDLDWQVLLMEAVRESDENRGAKTEERTALVATGRKILVIDDSLMLLSFVKEMLREHNYKVATAATADEGLQECHRGNPDLILLDYVLPDMKGDEVCRKLMADPVTAEIPVVYMSGLGTDLPAPEKELPNVIGALSKPFTSESLIAALAKFLPEEEDSSAEREAEKKPEAVEPTASVTPQPAEESKAIRAIESMPISLGKNVELKSATHPMNDPKLETSMPTREPFIPAGTRALGEIPSGPIRAIEPPPPIPTPSPTGEKSPESSAESGESTISKIAPSPKPEPSGPIVSAENLPAGDSLGERPAPKKLPGAEPEIKTEFASLPPVIPDQTSAPLLSPELPELDEKTATAPEEVPLPQSSSAYFCGDSSFFSLHWALQTIAREKLTGMLRAFWPKESVQLLARDGQVIIVTTRDPQLYCEESPVTLLNLDPQRIEAAREQQRQNGRPIFLTLAEEGLILHEPGIQLVQHYGQKLFAQLWPTERVRFVFEEQSLPDYTRGLSPAEQNIDQWALTTLRFVQYGELGKSPAMESGCVPAYTRDGFDRVQQLRLTDAEAQFASQFNGTRSIAQIAKNLRLDIKFARLTLFRFLALEIVDCWPAQPAQKSESRGGLRGIFGRQAKA